MLVAAYIGWLLFSLRDVTNRKGSGDHSLPRNVRYLLNFMMIVMIMAMGMIMVMMTMMMMVSYFHYIRFV